MTQARERFSPDELAICLSHYDLGTIKSIKEFPRGSRRAPKAIIRSEKGKFLLKRRAKGKDDLAKVGFTHRIQLHLAAQNFPLPHLIGTKKDNNSLLVLNDNIYELFEFVSGGPYDSSLDATYHAGRILALYHKLLLDFRSDLRLQTHSTAFGDLFKPPTGSYHDAKAIAKAIRNTVSTLPLDARPPVEVLTETIESLAAAYTACAEKVNEMGLNDWTVQIVHGDWHPGNMLFRNKVVVAVIDYDAARLHQRVIDIANGALQFAILGGSKDPSTWPDHLDVSRFKRFLRGYDAVNVISVAEVQAVPYLMCEAMIAEAVLPIAATGSFGRYEGFPFLQMIDRKVKWIHENLETLVSVLED